MRMHTALHLLCSVVEGGVTGGQIGLEKSRLDFDIGVNSLDKKIIEDTLNKIIKDDYPLKSIWISQKEMELQKDLVRTMSVKPPVGNGDLRLIEIKDTKIIVLNMSTCFFYLSYM